jgi:glycosyltransferase involved in cell wall biosynthesis
MKLSIITINYNNAAVLKKTLDSVASQTYTDFEHIIVDGASTDGGVEIIHEYEQSLVSNLSPLA